METVLIDMFVVPEQSMSALLERAGKIQSFIKTLPGFVEGHVLEQHSGEGRYNLLTIAVWADAESLEAAKQAVALEAKSQGINLQETRRQLQVESVRGIYTRTPY